MTPFPCRLDEHVELILLRDGDADALLTLIDANRASLGRWLEWTTAVQSTDDARAFIDRVTLKHAGGSGYHVGIWVDGQLAGGVSCRAIDRDNRKASIGYWLGSEFTGGGLVTRACRIVIADLFERENLRRVELQAAVDNLPSRAVAERLGFTFEGVKRESEWVAGDFRDHAVYALLDRDWPRF